MAAENLRGTSLFGVILNAAKQGLGTADIWDKIRGVQDAIAATGQEPPSVSASDVSTLRGIAGGAVRSIDAIASAEPGQAITGDMIWSPPWEQTSLAGVLPSTWRVSYGYEVLNPDGTTSQAYGSFTTMDLSTVGSVTQDALDAAQSDSTSYGTTFGSLGNIDIQQVI